MDLSGRGFRQRCILRLASLFLLLGAVLGAQATPPDVIPGRKPDSKEPWGAFLGRTAHFVIGEQYRAAHPTSTVFLDPAHLSTIVETGQLGDVKRLPEFVRRLRPDITDTDARVLFEIKPDHEEGRREGREQAGRYLAALNAVIETDRKLVGGIGFEGDLLLEFHNGSALWRLVWRTPEPGVTLYRWSYKREKSGASWAERMAQKEEDIPKNELAQWGELAEKAVRNAYEGGERPPGFQGQVYRPVDCHSTGEADRRAQCQGRP